MHFWQDSNPLKCSDFSPNHILEFQDAFNAGKTQLPGSTYLITLIVIE